MKPRAILLPVVMLVPVASLAAATSSGRSGPAQTRPAMAIDAPHVVPPLVDPQADAILRRMSEYVSTLKEFSITAEATYDEVPEPGVQKLQFSRSLRVDVRRPDRLRSVVQGDDVNRAVWYDGRELDILDVARNVYCRVKTPPTIDATLEELQTRYGLSVPLADLLFTDAWEGMKRNVRTARYVGLHRVGTHDCHHLAFTQQNIDWQIWIDAGDHPFPRKLVIAHKNEPEWPQYCAVLHTWDISPRFADDHFRFAPPAGAVEADIEQQPARGRR